MSLSAPQDDPAPWS